jgi:CRISPR-associated protein (TIGR03986 family)
MSTYPKQKSGIKPNSNPEQNRAAIAPYNFVALPDRVIAAPEASEQQQVCIKEDKERNPHPALVRHDCYFPDRHTGYITGKIIADSPIYTRTGLSPEDFALLASTSFHEMTEEQKERYAKFFALQGNPTIPGSSLRGMFRMLVEIISHAKVTRVQKEKLFYRSLADKATREIYTNNFVQIGRHNNVSCYEVKIRTGFLRKKGGKYVIEECGYGRIDTKTYRKDLYNTGIPNWQYQNKQVYVKIEPHASWHFFREQVNTKTHRMRHPDLYLRYREVTDMVDEPKQGYQEGIMVITGDMKFKHLEFVFLKETLHNYPVSDDIIHRFHDDDQITQWQEKSFPKDQPYPDCRSKKGGLRDGEPVFFLSNDDGTVRFLGRAQMFRLPYPYSPRDFVPEDLRDPTITDLAEALFGYVPDAKDAKDTRQAYAGRVFFEDAPLVANNNNVTDKPYMHPRILSSPKPTTFQHYLVQPEYQRQQLKHYASKPGDETVIRGHKLYWHQERARREQNQSWHERIEDTSANAATSSQHTGIQPLDVGATFAVKIHFENLSDVELGVLLWIMQIAGDENYRLKLGMGKPLGMGTIRLEETTVVQSKRKQRYSKLFASAGQWETGEELMGEDEQNVCIKAFQEYVLDYYQCDPEVAFEKLPRIQMLLSLLSYPGPAHDQTRYMEIERDTAKGYISGNPRSDNKVNEYANRPVLPCPLDVLGEQSQAECEMIEEHPQKNLGIIEELATSNKAGRVKDAEDKTYFYMNEFVSAGETLQKHQRIWFRIEERKIPIKKRENKRRICAVDIEVYRE